jgi:alpha-beta hydrolase superfamily lysophospholipase
VHGIGAEKSQFLPSVEVLYRRGWHVLAYDQRNHGESGGCTTTLGVAEAEDLERAWEVLLERTRDQRIPRVVFGVSMGGAAANLALPRLRDVDGLVLDSTFADVAHVAARRLPIGPLTGMALALARAFAVPITGRRALDVVPAEAAQQAPPGVDVLILHAPADPLIPFTEAEALRDAYAPRATLVPLAGAGHAGGVIVDAAHYAAVLEELAGGLEARAAAR